MSNSITSISEISTQKSFSVASYSSSILSVAGGALTVNDIAIIVGIFIALLTFAVNWIYQARRDKREKALHQINIEVAQKELKQHLTTDVKANKTETEIGIAS